MAILSISARSPEPVEKESVMKTAFTLLLATLGFTLAGCNTVAGIGKDVQRGGQVLQDAAKQR